MKIKIGELAGLTGCQSVTVRYYEKEKLLTAPERTEKNYRLYGDEDVERLKFIMHCRRHGMKISEIRELLAYRDKPEQDCTWVNTLVDVHISNVNEQITSLMHLKKCLQALRKACSGGNSGGSCGIMKNLGNEKGCCCLEQ